MFLEKSNGPGRAVSVGRTTQVPLLQHRPVELPSSVREPAMLGGDGALLLEAMTK